MTSEGFRGIDLFVFGDQRPIQLSQAQRRTSSGEGARLNAFSNTGDQIHLSSLPLKLFEILLASKVHGTNGLAFTLQLQKNRRRTLIGKLW